MTEHNLPDPAELPQPLPPGHRDFVPPPPAAPEPAPTPDVDPEPALADRGLWITERGPDLVERLREPGVGYIDDSEPLPNAIDQLLGVGVYARDGFNLRGAAITVDRSLWDFVVHVRQPGYPDSHDRVASKDHIGGLDWIESKVQELQQPVTEKGLPLVVVLGPNSIPAEYHPDIWERLESLAEDGKCSVVVLRERD